MPVSAFFFVGHGPRSDRTAITVRKLDYDTKQVPPLVRLPKDIVDRIFPLRFCPLNEWPAEAGFLEFFGCYRMSCDVINAVFRPDDVLDPHSKILPRGRLRANHPNSRPIR